MSSNKKTLIDGDFQVGSSHFKVDTDNNYVGFNNATPQNKIDVQIGARTGTHSTDKPLYVTGVTATSGAEFVSDDGTAGIGIGSSNIFTTETNQNLTITPDGTGAVGIKTSTPNPTGETFDLWVQGDTKITGNVTADHLFGDGSGLFNLVGTQWVSSSEDIYFLNNTGSGEGKVGIGKTVPEYKLDILDSGKPTIRVKSTSTGDGDALLILDSSATGESDIDFNHDGVLNWRIRTGDESASGTSFQVNNANDSDVLTIQQNGNVGIGTDSPNVPLEVNKSAGGEMFRLATSTGTLYAGVDANPPWFGTSSDDHLRLMTNGTEKVRIESGGRVGIGVTDPGTALDVNGTVTATSFTGIQASDVPTLNQNTTGNAGSATNVRVDRYDTGDTTMYITMVSDGTESTSKRLYMDNGLVYDNTNNELKLSSIQIDDYIYHKGDTDTYFGFDAADHFRIVEGGGTRFQVDNTGNIGIGTTSPGAPLHIYRSDNTFGNLVELLRLERYTTDFDNRIDAAGGYIGFHANDQNNPIGEVARISFRQKGESSTANAENDGGMGFWTKLNDSLAERMTIAPNGRVGIGTTDPSSPLHVSASTTSTHTMKISHTDTNATSGTHALLIDANYSGADTFTGDKPNAGLYIDLDSSATGGDTSQEHRIYGVYSDVRHSGDSDNCYSGYFYARSDHTSGTCSALRGVYAVTQDSANGTNSNNTAGEFKALKDSGSTNTTATMMGVRGEVEVDAGTVTNAYAIHGHIDRDGGTITNGYLFHGSYAGSDTGVKWGLHLSGDEKNHVDGSFGIGVTPSEKLEVSGNIKLNGSGHQIYFDTGGAGLYWGDGYSRIVDNNDLRICTDDNLHFNTGCSSSSLGTERMVIKSDGDVGIGTADPLGRLHVSGGNGDCVVVIQADENNSGESDNPTLLFIQDGTFRTSEIGNDTNNGMVYRSYGDQIWYSSSVHSNTSNTALKDNQTERMRLTNGGNFGINTTSPNYKLEVIGTSRFEGEMQWGLGTNTSHAGYSTNKDWYIRSGENAGKVIIQDSGGNTGIGTSSPSQKLHVDGNIKLSGSGRQIYLDTGGAGLYWGAGYTRIVDDGNLRVCTDDIMHFNTGSNSGSLGTERMRIEASGLAYFNNALRVYGIEATINYTSSNYAYKATGLVPDPGAYSFGLYVDRNVRSQGYVAFSDRRIKSNVVDINDTTALDQLRQLQPKYYEYVDKVARGSSTVIGFIAQEVKEVVPQAVSVADGLIPNIYQTANVSANTITFTNFDTSDLDATSNTLAVFEGGETRKDLTIVEVVNEHTIRVDKDITGEDVFVYGQVVQDFHHINKDYLWTIATSALQEVDRQLQAEKARNDALEARILALESA